MRASAWRALAGRRDSAGSGGAVLATFGLTRERFHALPRWQQRLGKVALGGVIAFLISIFVNVLEHFVRRDGHRPRS